MYKRFTSYLLTLFLFLSFGSSLPVTNAQVTSESLGYKMLAESNPESEKTRVQDYRVIDGDTYDFILERDDEPSIKARILLIDTPELRPKQAYAQEAADRVRELFEEADTIEIEYEGPKKDRYGRDLVHVWVDGLLLQEILVTEGYAIPRYIHNYPVRNSPHVEALYHSVDYAERNGLNVWHDGDENFLAKCERPGGQVGGTARIASTTNPNTQQPASQESSRNTTNPSNNSNNSNPPASQTPVTQVEEEVTYVEETTPVVEEVAEVTVYIAPHSGTKYHYNPNCRGLRNALSVQGIPLSEAQAMGYTLCGYEH